MLLSLKYLFANILIISLLSFQFSELLILTSFKINQDYIAKNLCIEKDIEGSTCKGCCQLEKRITQQEESKKEMPANTSEKLEINFFAESNLIVENIFSELSILFSAISCIYTFQITHQVFHPPQNLV